MVFRKQIRKGAGKASQTVANQTRASRLRLLSTGSDTASDALITEETAQVTSSATRTASKRVVARKDFGRAPKVRATGTGPCTDREKSYELANCNEMDTRRGERLNLDPDTDLAFAALPSDSNAAVFSNGRQIIAAASASPDEVNGLKQKVSDLEDQLSKSNTRLMAVLDRYEEQVKELKKSVGQKNATIAMLESCQSSVSKSSGQNPLTEVDQEYRPVMNKIRGQLRAEADDLAREVVSSNSNSIRDWRGKVEKVSSDVNGELLITVSGEENFVAKCPMSLASQGEFFTKPAPQQLLLKEVIQTFVHEDTVMSEVEKLRCISRLSQTKYLTQWWGRVLSEQHSKCKAALPSTFLGALGYYYIHKHIKPKAEQLEQVIKEQKHARSSLRKYDEKGDPNFAYWRMAPISSIQYEASENDEEFDEDFFFRSKAARDAFLAYRSHEHENKDEGDSDATILSLARADAWMFVYIDVMKEDGAYGRGGGSRSDEMKKMFKKCLPHALENILRTCRLHVAEKRSAELVPIVGRGSVLDVYGNANRKLTTAFRMPSSGLDYLAIKPDYFRKAICPSMGLVKDCYIGRCKPKSKLFSEIRRNELLHDEASDEELDEIEDEELGREDEEEIGSR